MAKWRKPSGLEIETNDEKATIAHCVHLGWERTDEVTEGDPEVPQMEQVLPGDTIESPAANPEPMDNDAPAPKSGAKGKK